MGKIIKSVALTPVNHIVYCMQPWLPPEMEIIGTQIVDGMLNIIISFDARLEFEEVRYHFHVGLMDREFFVDEGKFICTFEGDGMALFLMQIVDGDWGYGAQEYKERFGADELSDSRYDAYMSEVKAKREAKAQREQEELQKELNSLEAFVKEYLNLLGIEPEDNDENDDVNPSLN